MVDSGSRPAAFNEAASLLLTCVMVSLEYVRYRSMCLVRYERAAHVTRRGREIRWREGSAKTQVTRTSG
jgi:hypothetical protein